MNKDNYIIGLNCYHADSSAALLKNGEVIAATEEERFTRVKHWAGLPLKSIEFCLMHENISIEDIDCIAIGRDTKAKYLKKLGYLSKHPASTVGLIKQRILNKKEVQNVHSEIKAHFGYCPPISNIEHHRAHLASAFYSSPYNESAIISIDGSGDFSTLMIGSGTKEKIRVLSSVDFPVSIGLFYSAFTQFLGFPYYGDEYKVMGLSPYGEPKYLDKIKDIIWFDEDKLLAWNSEYFQVGDSAVEYVDNIPLVSQLFNRDMFESVFGASRGRNEAINQNHKDIAASLQRHTENLIFAIVNKAIQETGMTTVCIAGGVAQNSVANGKIIQNTKATELYIPSAGHDAGISMGAAQYEFYHNRNNPRTKPLFNANLGISFSNEEIAILLQELDMDSVFMKDDDLFPFLASKISSGNVIGFFDGRAEFGPRALGSRSILADPRNPQAQQLLNAKIKKRESFRPFAPSILEEYGDDYFHDYQFTPFMERVLKIREDKRMLIPAVTHVDGTGRLQSVSSELRPRYYRLIEAFHSITGIPILINTSFNENEPVVNIPNEAINTYLRTDLDILVLGNYVLKK